MSPTPTPMRKPAAEAPTGAKRLPAADAAGLLQTPPLQRHFRDIHMASAHIALTWDVHAASYGQSAPGLPLQSGLML